MRLGNLGWEKKRVRCASERVKPSVKKLIMNIFEVINIATFHKKKIFTVSYDVHVTSDLRLLGE